MKPGELPFISRQEGKGSQEGDNSDNGGRELTDAKPWTKPYISYTSAEPVGPICPCCVL